MNNFSCILHILRKITIMNCRNKRKLLIWIFCSKLKYSHKLLNHHYNCITQHVENLRLIIFPDAIIMSSHMSSNLGIFIIVDNAHQTLEPLLKINQDNVGTCMLFRMLCTAPLHESTKVTVSLFSEGNFFSKFCKLFFTLGKLRGSKMFLEFKVIFIGTFLRKLYHRFESSFEQNFTCFWTFFSQRSLIKLLKSTPFEETSFWVASEDDLN